MNRKVIYTCITGCYDKLMQPLVVDDTFDYICFSDSPISVGDGIWQIKEIPEMPVEGCKLSRYPKMHPHVLLKEYDFSIYVDANILIQQPSFYHSINNCISNNIILAGIKHPSVNCLYEEYYNVFKQRKETDLVRLWREYRVIKKSGFPKQYGMYEANIIYRDHHNPIVIKQCEDWWALYLKYTKRDQLSYSYTLWKNEIDTNYLMEVCGLHSDENASYKVLFHPNPSPKSDVWNKLLFKLLPEPLIKRVFYMLFDI